MEEELIELIRSADDPAEAIRIAVEIITEYLNS